MAVEKRLIDGQVLAGDDGLAKVQLQHPIHE
jgi:hypothetical protein